MEFLTGPLRCGPWGVGPLTSRWGLFAYGTSWWWLMHQEWGAEVASKRGGLEQREAERKHRDTMNHGETGSTQAWDHPTGGASLEGAERKQRYNEPWREGLYPSTGPPHRRTGLAGFVCSFCHRIAPTHCLARALLVGDLLRAPEVDADFACFTPQALLGVS